MARCASAALWTSTCHTRKEVRPHAERGVYVRPACLKKGTETIHHPIQQHGQRRRCNGCVTTYQSSLQPNSGRHGPVHTLPFIAVLELSIGRILRRKTRESRALSEKGELGSFCLLSLFLAIFHLCKFRFVVLLLLSARDLLEDSPEEIEN